MTSAHNERFLWRICLIACLGGLLFGYDWVVIGGAKPFFIRYFRLENSPDLVGWAMSSALVGCMVGAVLCGLLSDKFGRKRLLLLSALLFTVSGVGAALAATFSLFVWMRLLGGLGIGLASNLSPMYISEVSPAERRGAFVSLNQLTINIGVVSAQVVNWAIAYNLPSNFTSEQILNSWYGQVGWRWMFGAGAVPAFCFLVLMYFLPESPRWLLKAGHVEAAHDVLSRVGGPDYANSEVADIRRTLSQEEVAHVRFRDLLEPRLMLLVLIGMVLATLQQWCGLNVIFYYAEDVFKAAGYTVSGTMINIVYTGLTVLVFTVASILVVDRWGRRPLMLFGAGGIALVHALLGAGFHFHYKGVPMLVLMLVAMAIYALTLAPVMWVLLAELFPNRIRGAAMSLSVLTLWVTCWACAQFYPRINGVLGDAGSFWLFGGICLAGLAFMWRLLPETKGQSLEAIERKLLGPQAIR
ncbi:MAG: sugar porter family MFS transporter [Verrucomicrobia bacterium]|nr:sugar porter family MFS transporter [Verrucomicrobiota bacterium]